MEEAIADECVTIRERQPARRRLVWADEKDQPLELVKEFNGELLSRRRRRLDFSMLTPTSLSPT